MTEEQALQVLMRIYAPFPNHTMTDVYRDSWLNSALLSTDYELGIQVADDIISWLERPGQVTPAKFNEVKRQLTRPERTKSQYGLHAGEYQPSANGQVWMNHFAHVKPELGLGKPNIRQMSNREHTWIVGDTWDECRGCRQYAKQLAKELNMDVKPWVPPPGYETGKDGWAS